MRQMRQRRVQRRARQRGAFLFEALVAILLFAFGILGMVGLLGSTIRANNDARYRAEAANFAQAMVGEMWTMPATQMDTEFGPGGTKLANWRTRVAALLPAAGTYPPEVDLSVAGLSSQSRSVIVRVYWQLPGDTDRHQYLMTAQIGRNPTTP